MLQDPPHWMPRPMPAPKGNKSARQLNRREIPSTFTTLPERSRLTDHLVACQRLSCAARRVGVRRLDVDVPAHVVGPAVGIAALLVDLEALLAAAVGHSAIQGHVAVVRLC